MKKYLVFPILLTFLLSSNSTMAQEWLQSFEEATSQASKESKRILLVFQGSDWCAPCIKMDKTIWSDESFQIYAKENLVLLKADFPRRKKNSLSPAQEEHNAALAEKFNSQGIFPFVVILDKGGSVLGETGFKNCDGQTYVDHIQEF